MNARMRRISSDYEQLKKNFESHKNIVVEPIGEEPAEKYRVTYYVNGVYMLEDGRIETLGKHVVIITLHAEYPRYKPICTIATPIWHPNFRDGQICIGDIWGAGESLSDIIVNIGDMIQYKSWNSFSPLSADAAEWAIANKHLFPVGNINLWTGEEEDGTVKKDFEIDLEEGENDFAEEKTVAMDAVMAEETTEVVEEIESNEDENDFEITAEELEGVTFVPTAERMQGSRYGTTAKGGKFNFKTVLVKGIIWAFIGAFLGFLISEFAEPITSQKAVANLMGYDRIVEYYDYEEKANEVFEDINKAYERDCKKYKIDKKAEDSFVNWIKEKGTEYEDEVDDYLLYSELADEALESAYNIEFNGNGEKFESTMKNITRVSTALWSALIALFLGLLLGVGEGVYYGSKEKSWKYALVGAGVSVLVGAISGYVAQLLYASLLSEYSSAFTNALVRGVGWAIMGLGIGLSVGLIKPEVKRIAFCSIGGVIGAFLGGFMFNYICDIVPNEVLARGVAIAVMGTLIGIGVGSLEQFAKAAWLKVIRGEFEGKEYLVFEGITSIGNSGKNTIVLFKDKLIAPNHCDIVQEGSKYVIVDKGSPMGTVVNGMRVSRHVLRQGDAIAIGNSVLVFNTK